MGVEGRTRFVAMHELLHEELGGNVGSVGGRRDPLS